MLEGGCLPQYVDLCILPEEKVRRLADRLRKTKRKKERKGSFCQPRDRRRKFVPDASGDYLDAGILRDVRRLGHLPRRFWRPQSEEDKAECRLADRIRKSRGKLLPATLIFLKNLGSADRRMQGDTSLAGGGVHPADERPPRDARLLDEVSRLGHLPKLFQNPRSEKKTRQSTDWQTEKDKNSQRQAFAGNADLLAGIQVG